MKPLIKIEESTYNDSAQIGVQRLKSRIIKQISHEFRTPLTSILGFAEMLGEKIPIDETQRIEYSNYIRNEGLRLTKLVDDLIRLDSLEQGHKELQFMENEIQETVRNSLKLVAEAALNKFIHISIEMPLEPLIFKYDQEQLIHALYQLLHNAVRYSKHSGLLTLKVETDGAYAIISIQDNGPGIVERDIPSLFKRFGKMYHQGEEPHGSGVGLAIVKQIIDQHNGDISVQSKIGEGSIFTIRLPLLLS